LRAEFGRFEGFTGSDLMGQTLGIKALLDIDEIGQFDVLRFGVEDFGKDPMFPDDSHGLSEAGVGILVYRIQQAKRMVFSAQAGDPALRMRFAPDYKQYPRAFFSVATTVDGKPDHFQASLVFQNVLIESQKIVQPVKYIPILEIASIIADHVMINYSQTIGAPHDM
jgi:hypothetical protein